MIRIRRVDISDRVIQEAIQRMIYDCFAPGEWTSTKLWTRGDWWIAFNGEIDVAFGGMVPSQQWANVGYLCASGVLPEFRGHGLQKRLIKKRVQCARAHGWTHLVTETIVGNAASANSLIACGFRQFQPERPWGAPEAMYWRLEL
ncbi:MAG: GNAT family N-acetyltransferase [Rhodospirillaceae bacterium]